LFRSIIARQRRRHLIWRKFEGGFPSNIQVAAGTHGGMTFET